MDSGRDGRETGTPAMARPELVSIADRCPVLDHSPMRWVEPGFDHERPGESEMKSDSTKMPKEELKGKRYEKLLRKLQVKLCHLQAWVKHSGMRVIVVLEGRDAAGKGGTIKAITERVSPRVFRVVALPAPSDREKSQMYVQRYMAHFPA